jgi:uncharacterized protein (DUF2141 family)
VVAATIAIVVLGTWSGVKAAEEPRCGLDARAIVVRVAGVRNERGQVVAVLYGDVPEDFLKRGKRLRRERVPARPGSVELCVVPPGPGVYALAVFHDENDNLRVDRSWVGLPVEGYGFSNNPTGLLGVPSHAEVAFRVGTGSTTLDIRLHY